VPVLGVATPLGGVVDQKMVDKHNSLRLNKDAIKKSMAYHSDYHMKVVVNPVEMPETWNEIKAFMDELEVPKDKIWIMPPGDNREELIRVYPMVIQWCTDNYYNFTGREHIIAFDTKREV
jgi:7-carboxy-7-deazaguanine synthase